MHRHPLLPPLTAVLLALAVGPGARAEGDAAAAGPWGALEPVVQRGHPGPLDALAVSPDGTLLASAGGDFQILLWDLAEGALLRVLSGHRGVVRGLVFAPEGRELLYSASADGTVRSWHPPSGRQLGRIDLGAPAHSLALGFGGLRLAVGTDRDVQIWDAARGRLLVALRGHSAPVGTVAFLEAAGQVVSASTDRTVRVWEAGLHLTPGTPGRRLVQSLTGRWAAAVGDRIAVSGGQPADEVGLHLVRTGARQARVALGGPAAAGLAWRPPDAAQLAVARRDGTVAVIDWPAGRLRHEIAGRGPLAFTPDGRRLVTADAAGRIAVWDPTTGALALELSGRAVAVTDLEVSPDGRRLAAASRDGTTWIWDLATSRVLRKLRGHRGAVLAVSYAPRDRWVVTAGADGRTCFFDDIAGKQYDCPDLAHARRTKFSPQGDHLALVHGSTTELLRGKGFEHLRTLPGALLAFSPDGAQAVLTDPQGGVVVRDTATGEPVRSLPGSTATAAAWGPRGRRLAVASWPGYVRLHAGDAAAPPMGLQVGCPIHDLAFSRDGRWLAAAADDGTVRLWEVASGHLAHALPHGGPVRAVAFTPRGHLAAGGDDGWIRLWDPSRGEVLLRGHGIPDQDYISLWSDGRVLLPLEAEPFLRFSRGRSSLSLREALSLLPHPEAVALIE